MGVKPGDHPYWFAQVESRLRADPSPTWVQVDASTRVQRQYWFFDHLHINEANQKVLVHFLRYVETDTQGQQHAWTWVTDLRLTERDVDQGVRGGRARWRIENETFNTLKNQGDHFEHNDGHGYRQLAVVFAMLMLLAFLIDQVQQKCNPLFRLAWESKGSKRELGEAVRYLFASFGVSSRQAIYEVIAYGYHRPRLESLLEPVVPSGDGPNTS